MSEQVCEATKISPTAEGDVEVPCRKPAGHVAQGDPKHEGQVGIFPVRWTDDL